MRLHERNGEGERLTQRTYSIKLTQLPEGNVEVRYGGDLPVGIIIAQLEIFKLQLIVPLLGQRRDPAQSVEGMLLPNLKRIPLEKDDTAAARYRVA